MGSKRLAVEYVGSARGLQGTLGQIDAAHKTFGDRLKAAGTAIKQNLGRIGIAFGAFAVTSIKAFGESEEAQISLQNALNNNPKVIDKNVDSYLELAKAIQSKTRADDESIVQGAAVIARFKLTGDQIQDVLPLIVDYARKTGKDVPAAAAAIGKAALGNTRALKELGINYQTTGDEGTDFANITDLIREKVGGFAEEEAQSTLGRLDQMKNRFNDMQEAVGGGIVAFASMLDSIGILIPAVAALATAFLLAQIGITGPIGLIVAGVAALAAFVISNWEAIKEITIGVWGAVTNAVLSSVGDMLGWLTQGFAAFLGFFFDVAGGILAAADYAFGWIPVIGDKISSFRDGFNEATGRIMADLDRQAAEFHAWGNAASGELNGAALAAANLESQLRNIRPPTGMGMSHFQHGTRSAPGGFAWVGEAGRELMYVPRGSRIWPHGQGPGPADGAGGMVVNVFVAGSVLTQRDLVEGVREGLLDIRRRNGRTGLE